MKNKSLPIPESVQINCVSSEKRNFEEAYNLEFQWLEHVMNSLHTTDPEQADISWAPYHATKQPDSTITASITSLLPLFREEAHSVAMICHGMNVIKQAVNLLNLNQVPVIAMDQPLFALAKFIQWTWPDIYGESKFLIMFGGLHIKKASLNLLGDWLAGSGWTDALVQAKITSSGKADAILKSSHITRARHAHQVIASALHILLPNSYEEYTNPKKLSLQLPLITHTSKVIKFTKDVADATVCKTIRGIETIGSEQYKNVVETRLQKKEIHLSEPIKRNKLLTFNRAARRDISRSKLQVSSLKKDCNLFSRLDVCCQIRDGNQSCPPSLSNFGSIRSGAKSYLMECLQNEVVKQPVESSGDLDAPQVDSIIIDGAALINMLRPGRAKTFEEYAQNVFRPHRQAQLRNRK
eukprot:gene12494-13777_t